MHAVSRIFSCIRKTDGRTGVFRLIEVSARLPAGAPGQLNSGRHPGSIQGLYTTGRTPCGDKPERTTPSRSPFGARMQWPEPAYTEQSLARLRVPDEGRCRADPHCTRDGDRRHSSYPRSFSRFSAARPRLRRGCPPRGGSQHRTVKIDDTLMSYSQAEYARKLVDILQRRGSWHKRRRTSPRSPT